MRLFFILFLIGPVCFGQSSFLGLNTWTSSNVVGLSGSGYLIDSQFDFRNAAVLINSKRHIKFDIIKYPAGINSQTISGTSQYYNHNLGFKLSRINYGTFEGRNSDNQKTQDYSAYDIHIQGGYGLQSNSGRFNFGIIGGIFLGRIESNSARAISLEPAIIYNGKIFRIGFSIQNYGIILKHFGQTKDAMDATMVASISRAVQTLPLEIEVDYLYSKANDQRTLMLSGIIKLANGLKIRSGTSTGKAELMNDVSIIKNIFSDFGFGMGYEVDDINFDLNAYNYGPSGMVFSIGIAVFY